MAYVIGVGAGIFGIARERGPEEAIQYAGLSRKASGFPLRQGVMFAQIDLEAIAEFQEPGLKEEMRRIREDLGINYGIHSETIAFGGREIPYLDEAIELDYRRSHERLYQILKNSAEIEAKYVLLHSSESTSFLMIGRELQPTTLVDIWGRPLWKFLGEHIELKRWAIEQDFTKEIFLHGYTFVTIESQTRESLERWKIERRDEIKRIEVTRGQPLSEEEKQKFLTITPEIEGQVRKDVIESLTRRLDDFLRTSSLTYGSERLAYFFVAKWMEETKDPLWTNIVNDTIKYFVKLESKKRGKEITKEEWLKEKGIEKLSIDDEKFRRDYRLWVPAISAKYIIGHFTVGDVSDSPFRNMDFKKAIDESYKIHKSGTPFVMETPMSGAGIEEWTRLPNPIQFYHIVKTIGPRYIQIAMDLEHMLSSNIDPEVVIDSMPEDAGKFVMVIHSGYPAVLAPAHIPIPLPSSQQVYLYKMYFKLRQKGFGKDKNVNHFIIFERGGGEDPVKQSMYALRLIVENLEKDVPPEKLPMEFFGVSPEGFLSPQRQLAQIEEHVRDPLKGLLAVPEEEYTTLGTAALSKGKRPEEWKKEELK